MIRRRDWLRRALAFSVGCAGVVAFGGCRKPERRDSSKPLVGASFFPLYDFAREIGGTNFEIVCLVPPGGDPHAMEASPSAAKTVAGADLVLLLGLGLDGWVEKLAASERKVRTVTLSEGITTRRQGKAALVKYAGDAPDPNSVDPHFWLDPLLAQQIVKRITAELAALAPQHRATVQARSDAYLAELQKLHEDFSTGLTGLRHRQVVTFHGAFAYLFARYQLETVGVIEVFPGDEPSAAYLRRLVDLMRAAKLKVIFAEPQLPDRAAQVIAWEIGGRVERLDPCETILPHAPTATYLERQRKNLETLRRVLSEPPA